MPRQMYGLGSFVKSIGKGIKKIVKSPIGKAAILGFGANALIPGGLGSLFSGGSGLAGMFGKAKSFIGGLSGMQKFGGALALGGAFGGMEDQQIEELKSNPEALANYLRQYYSNLNQDATPTQIEEFVQRNMKAGGGRMGYADGTEKIVQPSASMMVDTTTSNPMPKEKSLKENLEFVKEIKGGVAPSTTIYMLKKYMDEALEKGQITKEQHIKMLMPFFGETGEGVTRDFERYEQKMAYGGRMGYANGMDPLPYITENGLRSLDIENLTDTQKQYLKNMKEIQDRQQESLMKKIKKLREGMPENERNMKPVPIRKIGPEGISGMAYGGRIMRAYGSDDLVEQASGIEGLDININPKGVKELDLRDSGGFIPPVGVKEKADDIPAMLSNNEFVFTADAVRAAGGGSVNKGAQIMYDTMKKLENGGTV